MRQRQLYQWFERIREGLPQLSKPQAMVLAMFSLGVVVAERCATSKVAERLSWLGKADSLERRFQRFLSNTRISWEHCCQAWSGWVIRKLGEHEIALLVDETKLGEWLGVMMVGLAYRNRCLPLAWMCYRAGAWPMKQVDMVKCLLEWVAANIPLGVTPLVLADRGIGTSPGLVQVVTGLGWHYLFRVQGQTRFRFKDGHEAALRSLARLGRSWSCSGRVFKKAGWLPARAHVLWKAAYTEPWYLITNCPRLHAERYALRAWQEQGFRDLKSGGWQWQHSQVRLPEHANLLVLVLALAYAWMLTLGLLLDHAASSVQRTIWRGSRCPYSIFRRGLRFFAHLFEARKLICTHFLFIPLKP
jgi:hypothetical protein